MTMPRVPLPGSTRAPAPNAQPAGAIDDAEQIAITLVLRRHSALDAKTVESGALTTEELRDAFGADPNDIELVRRIVTEAGVEVTEVDAASRRVRITGRADRLSALFGTRLERVTSTDPTSGTQVEHRHRQGDLSIPQDLSGVVTAVLGLDDRPQARAYLRMHTADQPPRSSFTPLDLASIYSMPAGTDGTGQTLAIIELGGGFGQSDLDTYFGGLGIATPTVTAVGVDGAQNVPGADPTGADGEVLLDIEVAGGIAPAATLVVYFAPNTDAGFLDAIATATHADPTPTAISISWGQSEDAWTEQSRIAMDQAFADAAALGITVTAAAGDNGSGDAATDSQAHVDFPAASPHVLACGGTRLNADPTAGTISSETVWNNGANGGATGGGVSDTFPMPSWQAQAGVPARSGGGMAGRGVPDVAGDADPQTGYQVFVDGQAAVYGGTSAVAPLWAALVCRLAQSLNRRLGLVQPMLYAGVTPGQPAVGLHDITSGDNGAYSAGAGWDACTGLGSPDGTALLAALQAMPAS